MTAYAWMLLPSGRRLDLLNPHPCAWTDEDLTIRLSRTYRWCSDTRPLTPGEQLRELLHDAEEGLINHDVPTPLKPLMGEAYHHMTRQVRRCINQRYDLPGWDRASHDAHKHADRQAAASEAHHVVGWSETDIGLDFGIAIPPMTTDPLTRTAHLQSWEPWPARLAACVFGERLQQLQRDTLDAVGTARIATMTPTGTGSRTANIPGPEQQPTFVLVEGGGETVEGQIVKGVRDEDGQWDLDGVFTVQTEDGELVKVHGWNCITEVQ